MKKEINLSCSCGDSANFSVEFTTFNQSRVNSLLRDLRDDASAWMTIHNNCKKVEEYDDGRDYPGPS